MIDLYSSATPNGHKVSIMLEELGLEYNVHAIDLSSGDQKKPAFLAINPNGRIPAIVDRAADDFAVFESGAIMLYLVEKTGQLLPVDSKQRSVAVQWLMFQMGGIGPMMGQANVFYRYWPEVYQPAIDRYQNECKRLFGVLEGRLEHHQYLAGELSVADIATYPWVRTHRWSGVPIDDFPAVQAWLARLDERPAFQRGLAVPEPMISPDDKDASAKFVKGAQSILAK